MPWNECKPMDERLKFIARLLDGEKMAPMCREFGISRVTGYKIFNRYKECGLDGLYDRSRATVPTGQQATLPGRAHASATNRRTAPQYASTELYFSISRLFRVGPRPAKTCLISTVISLLSVGVWPTCAGKPPPDKKRNYECVNFPP